MHNAPPVDAERCREGLIIESPRISPRGAHHSVVAVLRTWPARPDHAPECRSASRRPMPRSVTTEQRGISMEAS